MTASLSQVRLSRQRRSGGFTLVELMVAMVLGLLLSIGIMSLFSSTSNTNRLQNGLARLQESGRFAVTRMESDFRMAGGQFCSNRSSNALQGTSSPMWLGRTPQVFAANLALPDSDMNSVLPGTGAASPVAATAPYALSQRFFTQGYDCSTGTCTPALPSDIPATGLAVNRRVPRSDVLTVRYQRGTGWPVSVDGNCVSGGTITVNPQAGDDPVVFTRATKLALVSDCQNPSILPVASVAGNVITLGNVLPGATPTCTANATRDVRVFSFSDDFVTVTYYLAFRADANPDARPNTGSTRLIPTLIRRENGVEQELVQGVDQLVFRYGVQDRAGDTRYLTAAQVNNRLGSTVNCPLKPEGVAPNPGTTTAMEPGCLWRAVREIEANLLVNTVDDVNGLDPISRSFTFMGTNTAVNAAGTTALPSGLQAGRMLRRQFTAQTTNRNYSP